MRDHPLPTLRDSLRFDLPAGLVVFLVAVPLCLGIALASGAPLLSGLVAGMVGGLVVPLLSRAELSVCGPAAGLAAIVLTGITTLGSFEVFTVALILAGILQVVMGALRFGRFSAWFPTGVVAGMLAAIGVLLIIKQLPHAVGFDREAFAIENASTSPGPSALIAAIEPTAVIAALTAMASLIGWEKLSKRRGGTFLPAPLVAVLVGVSTHELVRAVAPGRALVAEHMVNIPDAAAWKASLAVPDFSLWLRQDVWVVAVTVAVVASIESLLNVEAMDRLDPFARRSPMNRELIAQGVGNTLAGFLGGLPITSVVVRSSAALQAGARTRGAALVHGLLLVLTIFVLGPLLERIPLACLAAILLVTGYKLAGPVVFRSAWKAGLENFIPFAATLIGVVALDLLKGVGIGLAVAMALAVRRALGRAVEVVQEEGRLIVRLVRDVPFFARADLQAALDSVPPKGRVVVDAEGATSVHKDVQEAIRTFVDNAPRRSVEVEVRGLAGVGSPVAAE
ncbi:MAG: SulP family inorganic anion transporter [Myxococcales bacterium]|nr:SulP family inorganic anion transporter [Myxococcales bacterium]